MRAWALLALTVLTVAGLGAICVGPQHGGVNGPRDASSAALKKFTSQEELRSYMSSQAKAQYRQDYTGTGGLFGWMGGMAPMADMATGNAEETAGDSQTYSTTNVQEAGVDESDIIKNDGEYIYMLTNDVIHVIKAATPEEIATIEVDQGGNSMYLRDGQLIAISTSGWLMYGYPGMPMMPGGVGDMEAGAVLESASTTTAKVSARMRVSMVGPWFDGAQTTVAVIDVTDPANPVVDKTFRFEGSLASSRLIDGKLHLVLTTTPRLPTDLSEATIDGMTADEWLPDVQVQSSGGEVATSKAVTWSNCLYPVDPNGYAMTSLTTLDRDNLDAELATTALTANNETVYASTAALYLTDTQYSYDTFTSRSDTMIHKLAFTDSGTEYIASGLVPGRPLSQYSLGENDDYLRIATSNEEFRMGGEDLSSGVYVLGVNDDKLDIVGSIKNIAPGERIYAARFLGDRGFLVTYRQVDPLFAMDLSDPAKPAIVGELKVPGYSEHIQLLDANHLLTIGHDTVSANGWDWVQGVLLTIFDISDMSKPQILEVNGEPARVSIGDRGTYSEATGNPKAFNYYPAKNALAFPIDLYESAGEYDWYGMHEFNGLYVYRVTVENGFEYLGRIASSEGQTNDSCFQSYYGPTRGVFIGNNIYSVTDHDVQAASLDDVGTISGQADLSGDNSLYDYCGPQGVPAGPPELIVPASDDLK